MIFISSAVSIIIVHIIIIMTIVMNAPQLGIIGLYNGISDSGLSEIGTLYNKPLQRTLFEVQINYMPYSINFRTSTRGDLLYKGQTS